MSCFGWTRDADYLKRGKKKWDVDESVSTHFNPLQVGEFGINMSIF